jgi:hypothetical protein
MQASAARSAERLHMLHGQSNANAREFIERMHARSIGTIPLFEVTKEQIRKRAGWFREDTVYSHDEYTFLQKGAGWLLAEGFVDYDNRINWILLESGLTVKCRAMGENHAAPNAPPRPSALTDSFTHDIVQLPFLEDSSGLNILAGAAQRLAPN